MAVGSLDGGDGTAMASTSAEGDVGVAGLIRSGANTGSGFSASECVLVWVAQASGSRS